MAATSRKTTAARKPSAADPRPAGQVRAPRLALALQGSFGHIDYAAGLLDAFRAHNRRVHDQPAAAGAKPLDIATASGCVEMLTPLWLYLADQKGDRSLRAAVLDGDKHLAPWAQQRIAPPVVRRDAWHGYLSGLMDAQSRFAEAGMKMFAHAPGTAAAAELNAAWQNIAMFGSGLPGQIAFNPFFTAGKEAALGALCAGETGPTVFTNATRARDFQEIYLYSGAAPDAEQQRALTGKRQQRQALRMTPEYFFASGARPPYIAPMPVTVDGQTEHWMEGAMRCNPPLVPLIDMDATHILLIRFFSKDVRDEPNNHAELNERFLDAIFSIPLQKELESIELNNHIARCMEQVPVDAPLAESLRKRREITILDPADSNNPAASPAYIEFLSEELTALSHYDGQSPARRARMFDRGFQIGQQLISDLQGQLP
ncbi:hypothetical protein [Noviherbaspirillum sedimenti]|uniref:PNPLA domain-containing protein n=1 Tax=Noviherbaspirillum sedimenti TaxID=2320865 RepID=A0A3A3G6V8_9BURK|nr:hypothetical protein [Noviherbaspirillum sedimenti]RJG02282.1 hypothetical protein D3878_12430 [Noviherbaspirillum sedimenti]